MTQTHRLIGLDPGLQRTGWGIIDVTGTRLRHVANGVLTSNRGLSLAERLMQLHDGLNAVLDEWRPTAAAVEIVFVNKDPVATLKLGQARAIALLAPAQAGIRVAEYAPNQIKKTVVGVGHAGKDQIHHMVGVLLPGCRIAGADAADALAVAICHAHESLGGAARSRIIAEAVNRAGGGKAGA